MIAPLECDWCGKVALDYYHIKHIEPGKDGWLETTDVIFICRRCAGENRWRVANVVTGEK